MFELAERTAFITGGAQGIGLGIARAFAKEGARLALVDLHESALDTARAELSALTRVETFALDVTDRDAYARVADEAEERLGPVTVLCNNAGVGGSYPIASMTYELWDLLVGTNLGGVVNGIQTFLPRMIARGEPAHVVNTASAAGLAPGGSAAGYMYEGTKAGVIGLSEALSKQLGHEGHPIGMTVLCPGPVATNLVATGRAAHGRRSGEVALTSEQASEHEGQLTEQESYLKYLGLPVETVGQMLVDGLRAGRTHVVTDRSMAESIGIRAKTLFTSLPAETEHDRRIAKQTAAQMREHLKSGGTTTR
ncbi:SDR family NAD(P)-dependent oxidoreductase [Streptomyces sp. AJS327]|uniref:SDR family oxidoreductase n=1 Tax=Streptomyces sp. AJS327 TaxID=2545265 RepID=UPI0015DF6C17|nr:SDR family NAD(P)-dependent oxidoreductase [Streptomyces sp. AJS327]MBA0052501.1 SDR family NAD(P)-dependent oxidoreductase [Streptomyces sp. AJS327]QNN81304.1 IonCII [Streptomyces sp.]